MSRQFQRELFSLWQWTEWTPSWTNWTLGTLHEAKYCQMGDCVFFLVNADGTTGSSAVSKIQFTLPIDAVVSNYGVPTSGFFRDGANYGAGLCFPGNVAVGTADLIKYDFSNFSTSAAAEVRASGFYRIR